MASTESRPSSANPDFVSELETIINDTNTIRAPLYISNDSIKQANKDSVNGFMQITKSDGSQGSQSHLKNVFEQAFPNLEFELTTDEQGKKGIRSKPKPTLARADETGQVIPEGYSFATAEQGVKDIQAALEAEKDPKKKFEIASRLSIAVASLKAHRFADFKRRAEAEFGIPELEMAHQRIYQAELTNPNNPGTGMPSMQRMALIESLGVQRVRAANRIQEMLAHDVTIASAEALAKGTMDGIRGSAQLENLFEGIDLKQQRKDTRESTIRNYEPAFLQSVSIIKHGKRTDDLYGIGENIYDGKIKLNKVEEFLVGANPDSLKEFYVKSNNPKDRELALKLLQSHEEDVVGNKEVAQRNVNLFRTISDKNLSNNADVEIPAHIKRKYKQADVEAAGKAAASGRSKDEMLDESSRALKREMLTELTKQAIYKDVNQWNGLIRSDETAQAVIRANGNKPMNLQKFADAYMAYKDNRSFADKGKAFNAIITSATESIPRSIILPIPSAESIQLEAQRIIASQAFNFFFSNPLSSGYAGGGTFGLDEFNRNLGRGQ